MAREIKDADEYRDWIAAHPRGYVACADHNSTWNSSFRFFIHRSTCANVNPPWNEPDNWKIKVPPRGCRKIVSDSYKGLLKWGVKEGYGVLMKDHVQCVRKKNALIDHAYLFRTRRDLIKSNQEGGEISVKLSNHWRGQYRPRDAVVFYQLESRPGIYFLGEVTKADAYSRTRIKMKVVRQLDKAILKAEIDRDPAMEKLSRMIAEAGEMPAGDEVYDFDENKICYSQWDILKKRIGIGATGLLGEKND